MPFLHNGNPYGFGRVAYAHGLGIDAPVTVVRVEYSGMLKHAISIQPVSNWAQRYDGGAGLECVYYGDGQTTRIAEEVDDPGSEWEVDGPVTPPGYRGTMRHCVSVDWPAQGAWLNLHEKPDDFHARKSWMGSLIPHGRDASGQYYRRNRYYDPSAGRFTQEDPIGLAGGINLYGYADGDPITYSDPFGLFAVSGCPPICNELNPRHLELEVQRAQNATPEEIAFGGVAILAASAAVLAPEILPILGAGARRLWNKLKGVADDVPDNHVVVRGGTGDVPPPGQVFSGASGNTLQEATAGVPHGTIRTTTAREIRRSGGTVTHKPELTRSGVMNERHVDICRGRCPCPFSEPRPNPVPKSERIN